MTREETVKNLLTELIDMIDNGSQKDLDRADEISKTILEVIEKEPCCNCIEFKRYAKQMGFSIEKESIPYLMHKEMNIPISECQKAYDVAIEYLRSQGKLKG
jgi:hypothetical protein